MRGVEALVLHRHECLARILECDPDGAREAERVTAVAAFLQDLLRAAERGESFT